MESSGKGDEFGPDWKDRVMMEARLQYTTSRGPGGQHVNKTESAAILRWKLWGTNAFNRDQLKRIIEKLQSQLNNEGEIVVRSDEFRSQSQNEDASRGKLLLILEKALFVPKPRKPTKPKKSAVRKRLDSKTKRGEIKAGRAKVKY